jgi:hypothetical protein
MVLFYALYIIHGSIVYVRYTWFYPTNYMLHMILSYALCVIHGFFVCIKCLKFYRVLYKFRRSLSLCVADGYHATTRCRFCFSVVLPVSTHNISNPLWLRWFENHIAFVGPNAKLCKKSKFLIHCCLQLWNQILNWVTLSMAWSKDWAKL